MTTLACRRGGPKPSSQATAHAVHVHKHKSWQPTTRATTFGHENRSRDGKTVGQATSPKGPPELTPEVHQPPISSTPEGTSRVDLITRRAYERFQMRGGEHGRDQEDWLEAERELNQGEE